MKQINLIYYSVFFCGICFRFYPYDSYISYPIFFFIRSIIASATDVKSYAIIYRTHSPEKDLKEIVQIEKQFYSFFCDYIVERSSYSPFQKTN